MSNGIDARAYLNGWLQGVTGMYLADVAALPEDKWTATFGGCTRPASELTGDALNFLAWTTHVLKGEAAPDMRETMGPMIARCGTKESASEAMKEVTAAFSAAFMAASDEALNATVAVPWGESPLFGICNTAVSHIWYHDGQLNYIQSLLGDDQVHWMG
jgi:hypothetical protein